MEPTLIFEAIQTMCPHPYSLLFVSSKAEETIDACRKTLTHVVMNHFVHWLIHPTQHGQAAGADKADDKSCCQKDDLEPMLLPNDHPPLTCSSNSNITARNQESFTIAMTDAIQIPFPPAIRSRRAGTCRCGDRAGVARWLAQW